MTTKGIEPNPRFDAAMVAAYCALGDIERAMSVLEEMRADGVPVNHDVFHSLIREKALVGKIASEIARSEMLLQIGYHWVPPPQYEYGPIT